jgi:hypothetical protein
MVQSDQQENKLRVPYLLFYQNVCLSLIVHICRYTCYTVVLLVAYPLPKSKTFCKVDINTVTLKLTFL